jgi:hypothetical protein
VSTCWCSVIDTGVVVGREKAMGPRFSCVSYAYIVSMAIENFEFKVLVVRSSLVMDQNMMPNAVTL